METILPNLNKDERMNIWKIIAIGLIIVVIGLGLFFLFNYTSNLAYTKGYSAGALYTSQTGKIPYIDNNTLKEITAEQFCNAVLNNNG